MPFMFVNNKRIKNDTRKKNLKNGIFLKKKCNGQSGCTTKCLNLTYSPLPLLLLAYY